MWICLNNAFLSVVATDSPEIMVVRARNVGHIEAVFPKAKVVSYPMSDYAYRAEISREQVAEAIANQIKNIDYKNFKDSVVDPHLAAMYNRFWSDMYEYQYKNKPKFEHLYDDWFKPYVQQVSGKKRKQKA